MTSAEGSVTIGATFALMPRPGATAGIPDDHLGRRLASTTKRPNRLSGRLAAAGLGPGDRVAVVMPDGPGIHAV